MTLADKRRRVPFRLGHLPVLDGIRGVAVVLVVVYHLGQLLWPGAEAWLLPGGFVGVDLFFALSGFLITCLLVSELDRRGHIRLRSFIWRRILRLSPVLACALGLLWIGTVLGWVPHDPLVQAKRSVWTLLYLQTWNPRDHYPHPELAQSWSLAVEMHFYLLWSAVTAVIVALWPRRARRLMLGFAAGMVTLVLVTRAMRLLGGTHPLHLFSDSPNRIDGPFVGCLGGLAYASGWLGGLPRRWTAGLTAAALGGLALILATGDAFSDWYYLGGFTLAALLGTVIVVGAVRLGSGPLADALRWHPLQGLGRASYSLFLWHMPVFVILQREAPGWPIPVRATVALAITASLTAASYRWVELPVLRLRRAARARAEAEVSGTAPAATAAPTGERDALVTGAAGPPLAPSSPSLASPDPAAELGTL